MGIDLKIGGFFTGIADAYKAVKNDRTKTEAAMAAATQYHVPTRIQVGGRKLVAIDTGSTRKIMPQVKTSSSKRHIS